MLLTTDTRRIHYDLIGPQGASTACFGHALAADSGMWAEQIPAILALNPHTARLAGPQAILSDIRNPCSFARRCFKQPHHLREGN